MRNIKLLVEYEGTNYSGWQVQNGFPTIQGALIKSVSELTCTETHVNGASRTDAGVHAYWQVANFLTEARIPLVGIRNGLNTKLPKDISIRDVSEAPLEFDPRRHSKEKTYIYKVLNRPYSSALLRNFSWQVFKPLDVSLMRQGAVHMIGEKDFSSFRAAGCDVNHSIREVLSINIVEKEEPGLIEFEVRGTAFLRHMVRIMVGTLVAVGKGKIKPDDVHGVIESKDRTAAAMTAPPQGLCLMKIEY